VVDRMQKTMWNKIVSSLVSWIECAVFKQSVYAEVGLMLS